jgi:hypothetical protein
VAFPNAGIYPQTYTYRDVKGFTSTFHTFINVGGSTGVSPVDDGQSLANNLLAPMNACTNAAFQGSNGPLPETGVVQYGAAAQYAAIEQHVRMTFQDAAGGLHNFRIYAPKLSIFLSDQATVDPTSPSPAHAWIAVMLSSVNGVFFCGKNGIKLINFFGGLYGAAKTRRRYGILQLGAALTPEEPAE